MFSRPSLAADFRALGVRPGDVVMLHASVRAVGSIAGTPHEVHLALKDALTDAGTLMMYASCPRYYDEVGRGNLTDDEERALLDTLPPFDPHTAPAARDNGALVELFRTYPGTKVNAHVARFAVWGRHADSLMAKQPWNFAFGKGSALERLLELDGRILLLGCDHDHVTFLHYAEHVVDIPGKRIVRFKVPWPDGKGGREWREMAEVDTAEGAHASWPDRFFAQIVDGLIAETGNSGGLVGRARSFLISARELHQRASTEMTRLAAAGRRN